MLQCHREYRRNTRAGLLWKFRSKTLKPLSRLIFLLRPLKTLCLLSLFRTLWELHALCVKLCALNYSLFRTLWELHTLCVKLCALNYRLFRTLWELHVLCVKLHPALCGIFGGFRCEHPRFLLLVLLVVTVYASLQLRHHRATTRVNRRGGGGSSPVGGRNRPVDRRGSRTGVHRRGSRNRPVRSRFQRLHQLPHPPLNILIPHTRILTLQPLNLTPAGSATQLVAKAFGVEHQPRHHRRHRQQYPHDQQYPPTAIIHPQSKLCHVPILYLLRILLPCGHLSRFCQTWLGCRILPNPMWPMPYFVLTE